MNTFDKGGSGCPTGYVWDGANCIKDVNLPEQSVYGNEAKRKLQGSLIDKYNQAKRAYQDYRENAGLTKQRLKNEGASSIGVLQGQIKEYKNQLEEEKKTYDRAQKALNVLQKKDSANWKNKKLKDVMSAQGVDALRDLYSKGEMSDASFRDFYDNFGKQYDREATKTTADDQVKLEDSWYGKKDEEGRRRWMSNPMNVAKVAQGVAIAAPLAPFAPAVLANPLVQAGLTGYGVYDATTNTLPAAYRNYQQGQYAEMAGNLGMAALDLAPIPLVGTNLLDDALDAGKYLQKGYNQVATGNSALPIAWKVEKSLADAEAIKNSRALTDEEAEVLKKYLNTPYSVNNNQEYRKILDNITQTSSADLSQANQPLTRINNYYVSPGANPKLPTQYGQKITYPSQRSWSLGDGATIGFENRGRQRVIIPSRYVKDAKGFHAIDYTDPRLVTDGINRSVEKEIFGNVPEGYKVIGKSNEGGFENIIVKPIKTKPIVNSSVDDVNKGFKSEIDWAKWNKEIPENKALMQEYNAIEQQTKANDTWMKNPDGSPFQGTPEQFVQQNSENFKKAFPQSSSISYRGGLSEISEIKSQQELGKEAIKRKYNLTDADSEALEKLWNKSKDKLNSGKYTTDDYEAALKYAKGDKDKVLSLYTDIRNPKFTETGESFRVLEKDRQKLLSEGYDALITKPSSFYPEGENVLLKNNQIKSAIGNNGMFDMTNPNIYKSILPYAVPVGLGAGALTQEKKYGGSLAPNIPTYYQSKGTPIYRDTTALPFATGGDLDGGGDPMPGKPKLPKLSTNDMTAYIYDTVVKLIEEAKASGKIKEGEDLNAMGVTAQILLESGNGKSGLTQKYNNFGGIKANDSYIKRGGKYVGMNASGENVKSKWRIYDTPEEGLRDQINFYLDNPRYRKAGVLNAKTAQEHAQRVQNAGYAGNEKKYARQVMQMVNSIPNRLKKADPAKLQTFVSSYAPAQPPVVAQAPMQPAMPVQPVNVPPIVQQPIVPAVPLIQDTPGKLLTNEQLNQKIAINNSILGNTINNTANIENNSNVASQQNPSYPTTIEEDSVQPQLAQYLNYSPEYPQWPGIDVDFDMARSKSFNLPKMNKLSRWGYQPMFKKGRSTQLAFPVISDIEVTQYPSPISKIVQGVTGYNPNYYENTFDEEGNLIQGELERAKEEERPVEFQKGYSSIQDIFNRRAYNKQLEQMQPVPIVPATIEKAGGGFLASGYGSSLDEYYANGGQMKYTMYDVFENGTYYGKGGQMIKRADGSYSPRGLWDNIRANAGSGEPATEEMLTQERKINTKNYVNGGGIENTELSTNNLLPNTNNTTSSCPPFHIYDTTTGQCIPMSEKQKAEHSLQFMQGWSNSPMHNKMLQSSIQKDKLGEDVTSYFNNVAGLRNRATNTDINIVPADSSGVYGYAEPVYLSNLQGGNQNKIYSTNQNTPVNLELYKKELANKTLDPESRKEYTDFIKRNSNTNNIVGTSTFYTQNRPGEHAYVYPHEISHLQDIGGNLIPFSDKDLIKSNRDQEFLKGQQDIINSTPEKELYSKLYDFAKSYYPKSRQYEADKKMYEENFEKFKKQNPKLNFSNTKDNSMSYNDFINKNSTDAHWSKFLSNEDYIGTHTETRARLNAARMFGKEYGIYDPYTEKLTPEKYKQLLDIFEKQNPDTKDANQLRQLKEVFTDEQIINMMNTISKNDNKNILDVTSQLDNSNLFLKGGPLSRFYPSNIQEY
jgi:hypothetical protein